MPKNEKPFSHELRNSAQKTGSIICVGYDPAPVDFPQEGISGYDDQLPDPMSDYNGPEVKREIMTYFGDALAEMINSEELPGAFKPNLGYFEMYNQELEQVGEDLFKGSWGTAALEGTLQNIRRNTEIPIILDTKDADIGRSSAAYAVGKLKKDIDAITVHPEMGSDSVEPFFDLAEDQGQGVYVLTRTSNPGAKEFQDLIIKSKSEESFDDLKEKIYSEETENDYEKAYEIIAQKVVDWHEKYPGTVGSVIGATSPSELGEIVSIFHEKSTEGDIPLLIPGVGTQGGTVKEVLEVLEDVGYDLGVVRINNSSGTMYRAQKDGKPRDEHHIYTREELERLNSEVRGFKYALQFVGD